MKYKQPQIEIMDTTLRDGEQTSGVSFVPHEKLMIARLLLEELKVDRVEVASARVSDGEFDAVKMICDWAARRNLLPRVEVLGFVDGHTSVDWIHATGCRVINLLCKGSLKHCTCQLRKTPEEHIEDIIGVVNYANEQDMEVNIYLEDWSNGMRFSPDYVYEMVDTLKREPRRFQRHKLGVRRKFAKTQQRRDKHVAQRVGEKSAQFALVNRRHQTASPFFCVSFIPL